MQHWDIVISLDSRPSSNANTNAYAVPPPMSEAVDPTILPRDAMYPDEVVVCTQGGVGIYDREEQSKYQHGTLMLTSHRIIFKGSLDKSNKDVRTSLVNSNNRSQPQSPNGSGSSYYESTGGGGSPIFDASIFLPLDVVTTITWTRGFGTWSHPKIITNVTNPSAAAAGPPLFYKFSFRAGGLDPFYNHLERTLKNKLWEKKATTTAATPSNISNHRGPQPLASSSAAAGAATTTSQSAPSSSVAAAARTNNNTSTISPPPPPTTTSTSTAANTFNDSEEDLRYLTMGIGLTRAVQQKERKAEEAQVLLQHQRTQALTDVDALMRNANKLVEAIATLKRNANSASSSNAATTTATSASSSQQQQQQNEIISIEAALGIGTIVHSGGGGTFSAISAGYANSSAAWRDSGRTGGPSIFQHHEPSHRVPKFYNPTQFHVSLSQELLAWLVHPKNSYSRRSVIPLVELFSIYNKARQGEAVVSATDFLEAAITLSAIAVKNAATAVGSVTGGLASGHFPAPIFEGQLLQGTSSLTEAFIRSMCKVSANKTAVKISQLIGVGGASSSSSSAAAYESEQQILANEKKIYEILRESCKFAVFNENIRKKRRIMTQANASSSHEEFNAATATTHCDSQLLLTLGGFARSLGNVAANSNSSSSGGGGNNNSSIAIGNYYELKRFRNGSICLEVPMIGPRIITLLRTMLKVINNSGDVSSGGTPTSPTTAAADPFASASSISFDPPFVTVPRFATLLGVHADIAEELLEALELAGVLCRDDQKTFKSSGGNNKNKNNSGNRFSSLFLGDGSVVDDTTLTALWTTPLFGDDNNSKNKRSSNSRANARWFWNWFYPDAF